MPRDETGNAYGYLTVVSKEEDSGKWNCLCECGQTRVVLPGNLRNGSARHCGCKKIIDETGNRYGLLVVTQQANGPRPRSGVVWMCTCDCGKTRAASGVKLRRGKVRSCGCKNRNVKGMRNGVIQ